ncbi:DUF3857 domain-containing protein [Flammeovirga pacifica]|uniref:DUF3857 domain-containing protein n=1 Tax=Flammeovirga pacifica TaxID=915059 RepID=UPI0005C63B75|nr:DUF3857 domain-containing protein [Flammeovirga pacifica]
MTCIISHAQQIPKNLKFGKINKENLALTTFEKDTTANALVISNEGNTYFTIKEGRFVTFTKVHKRIKIFNKEAYDYGNIEIPYYEIKGVGDEKVTNIKGAVYSLEKGDVTKSKLSNDDVFHEEETESRRLCKITFPKLKEGCIIEYSYVKYSEFPSQLDDWVFQEEIPVLKSEYIFNVPEFYEYRVTNSRHFHVPESPKSTSQEVFTYNSGGAGGRNEQTTMDVDKRKWVIENIPAFKEEAFMSAPYDYYAKLQFDVLSVNFGREFITSSWAKVMNNLKNNSSVGAQIKRTSFMSDQLDLIAAKTTDKMERAQLAYAFIQNHMKWNNKIGYYSREGGTRRAFNERLGSVGDINLMLIAALKKLEVPTTAVFSSTRNSGKITSINPKRNQLNYVLACVNINEQFILLDATSKLRPFGMLPTRALNYQGVLMSNSSHINGEMINIRPLFEDYIGINSQLTLNDDFSAKGQLKYSYKGYAAYSWRNELLKTEEDEYLEKLEEKHEGILIDEYKNENLKDINKDGKENFHVTIENCIEKVGDQLLLNPLAMIEKTKNPFKLEKRNYPVEFPMEITRSYMIMVNLPKGYQVKEKPKPIVMKLPGNGGQIRYIVNPVNQQLVITFKLTIDKLVYTPEDYNALKFFFENAFKFQTKPILLEKSTL